MKKYKVINFNKDINIITGSKSSHSFWAKELQDQYGLYHLSIEEICKIWENYSEKYYCAGWLCASKESIEKAFNVELEETKE